MSYEEEQVGTQVENTWKGITDGFYRRLTDALIGAHSLVCLADLPTLPNSRSSQSWRFAYFLSCFPAAYTVEGSPKPGGRGGNTVVSFEGGLTRGIQPARLRVRISNKPRVPEQTNHKRPVSKRESRSTTSSQDRGTNISSRIGGWLAR